MSKEKNNETEKYLIGGADVGTGTLLFAKMNENNVEVNKMRDMFIYIQDNQISAAEMASSKLDYITQYEDDGQIEFHAVIGEDALKMANIFNSKINRPMAKGMLSPNEIHAAPIISSMFKTIIGEEVKGGQVVFSVPSEPMDLEEGEVAPLIFHTEMFKKIFKNIGFNEAIPLNEGMAVIYSECSKENFSGLGISFGSGQINCCLSYKGTQVLTFSLGRSGDWIDSFAASSCGLLPNKITTIKEKSDFSIQVPYTTSTNKKERIVRQSISFAFENLINYCINNITDYLNENSDSLEFDEEEFPIILAGGTSLVGGFEEKFKEIFKDVKNFPLNISEIRHAKNPIESVSVGCLVYSQWIFNKNNA